MSEKPEDIWEKAARLTRELQAAKQAKEMKQVSDWCRIKDLVERIYLSGYGDSRAGIWRELYLRYDGVTGQETSLLERPKDFFFENDALGLLTVIVEDMVRHR